jgi:D-alanyl-D-alanine carboxypeptidase
MSRPTPAKKAVRIALLIGTLISLYFVPWIIIKAWISPLPDTIPQQLDEALALGFDGIIVYVDQAGTTPQSYAAGWHDRKNKIPAYPDALFKIASINKLYHAVAITKLVRSGQLSLDKTVADYFPELAGRIQYAGQITVRMLLQHRSGIPNFTDTPNFWTNPPKSADDALERVFDLSADFEPDTDYAYCNTNYLLLALLIERVTGIGTFDYIREKILTPLGLKNTFASIHTVDMKRLMSGYYVGVEEDIKSADYGSMIATAEDVGIFLRALNDGSLFEEGEKEIYSSVYVYEHTGLIAGYQSIARYHPDIDAVIIQFVNTTNFDGYTWNVSEVVYNRIVEIVRRH